MMKKVLDLLLTTSFCFSALIFAGPGRLKPGELDGFRGIWWGIKISTLEGMRYTGTIPYRYPNFAKGHERGLKAYVRDSDILEFGGVKVGKIEYLFWNDRFFLARVTVEDRKNRLFKVFSSNFKKIRNFLSDKYGKGHKSRVNDRFDQYSWSGNEGAMRLSESEGKKIIIEIKSILLEEQMGEDIITNSPSIIRMP
jgi:hypothetical protein